MKSLLFCLLLLVGSSLRPVAPPAGNAAEHGERLIPPEQLASELRASEKPPITIFFVGFPVLYKGGHIPTAVLAGPASKAEGLHALKSAAAPLSRNSRLVIYCGCCPFSKCPNVVPAYTALHDMGFKHVQILHLETNFHTDWSARGLPVAKGG